VALIYLRQISGFQKVTVKKAGGGRHSLCLPPPAGASPKGGVA